MIEEGRNCWWFTRLWLIVEVLIRKNVVTTIKHFFICPNSYDKHVGVSFWLAFVSYLRSFGLTGLHFCFQLKGSISHIQIAQNIIIFQTNLPFLPIEYIWPEEFTNLSVCTAGKYLIEMLSVQIRTLWIGPIITGEYKLDEMAVKMYKGNRGNNSVYDIYSTFKYHYQGEKIPSM